MERLNKAAIITRLATKLRANGSWCGETHIQKATYLLQDLLNVPTDFAFVLYMHGPFSFDLRDELTSLRADGLLELQPQPAPYGPRFAPTPLSKRLQGKFPKTLAKHGEAIEFVAEALGGKHVDELERVATALYVTKRRTSDHDGSVQSRAKCLNRLKPHVPLPAAVKAVQEVDALTKQAQGTQN